MSSFPAHYTYEYVLEQYTPAILATSNPEHWGTGVHVQSQARDALLFLIVHAPASVFDQFSSHPFWAKWRSKSSTQTSLSLHFALRNAKDPEWIEKLLPLFDQEDLCAQSLSQMAVSRFHGVPQMMYLKEKGLLSFSDEMLAHVASFGSSETLEYLWQEGENHFKKRIEGVEASIIARHSKKTDYPREKILTMIWERWGFPPNQVLHEMHKKSLKLSEPEKLNLFFHKLHNPATTSWTDRDFLAYLHARAPRHMTEVKEKLKDPLWVIPPHVVDDFLRSSPVRGDTKQVLENLFLHQAIEQSTDAPSRPKTVKKM